MSNDQKKKLKNSLLLLFIIVIFFAVLSRFLQHNRTTLADLQNTTQTVEVTAHDNE